MQTEGTQPKTIDAYIASFPPDIQARMQQLRAAIREAAPDAEETIKYAMPTFMLGGNLVYFAAFKKHIGFYPVTAGMETFKAELAPYQSGKGSAQFPHDQPIPFDLVKKLVAFRVQENVEKVAAKSKKKERS